MGALLNRTVACDVYGTLIDTQAVPTRLTALVGEKAPAVSAVWRQKQLEYSFRRGLMGDYCDFSACTRQALLFACRQQQVEISDAGVTQAMQAYAELEPFSEICLVSSNAFDILGAAHAGLRTAWLRRDPQAILDPWDIEPDILAEDCSDLSSQLAPAR